LGTLVFLIEIYSLEISMLSYFYFSLSRIEYSNQVGDIQVEWALGAFVALMQSTNSEPSQTAATSTRSNRPLVAVLGMFLLYGVFMVSRWRKPKTKIIYDLEKGRYIITRLS
jgi:apyrase